MFKFSSLVCFLLLQLFLNAQTIDVVHYRYNLLLTDASDTLKGQAVIRIKFLENTNRFYLNLASVVNGKGMHVSALKSGTETFSFTHINDTLFITSGEGFKKGLVQDFFITYAGVPADGLIISKNKWNDRTFFGDNWPDRAHQWLPCNDRPDDKATVEFDVIAPETYKIISNGVLINEMAMGSNQRRTHWNESVPIPTKVMVIGAAHFAVKNFADSSITPVSAWVYRQDSAKGFYDYALAPGIIKFYTSYVGAFPFEKLANVQSKTIFGGMENASCIFYDERTVTGTRTSEALLAHEIAHQWFGNSATEKSFAHLWLSEGFATYMTHLYLEQKYGHDTLVKRLQEDRRKVIQFANQWPNAVVDSTSALMDLLNANSYEKGGWVLHMLRQQVGDSVFHNIIQAYYNRYKFSNADTWDFEKVAAEVSGKDLKPFFQQWLFTPGVPQLAASWDWNNGQLSVTIHQTQKQIFSFPLTIGVYGDLKKLEPHTINITQATETFAIPTAKKPVQVILDPATTLLFSGKISEQH